MDVITRERNKTTLRLSNNSQLIFRWIGPEQLAVELWKFGTDRYGHGLLFQENVILAADELITFFAALAQGQPREAA